MRYTTYLLACILTENSIDLHTTSFSSKEVHLTLHVIKNRRVSPLFIEFIHEGVWTDIWGVDGINLDQF